MGPTGCHSSKHKVKQWSWLEVWFSGLAECHTQAQSLRTTVFWLSLLARMSHGRGKGKGEHRFLPCSPVSCPSPRAPGLDATEIAHQAAGGRPAREGPSALPSSPSQTRLHSRTRGRSPDSCAGVWLWQWPLERVIGPPCWTKEVE